MYVRERWHHVHLSPDDFGVRHTTEKQPKSNRETTRCEIQRRPDMSKFARFGIRDLSNQQSKCIFGRYWVDIVIFQEGTLDDFEIDLSAVERAELQALRKRRQLHSWPKVQTPSVNQCSVYSTYAYSNLTITYLRWHRPSMRTQNDHPCHRYVPYTPFMIYSNSNLILCCFQPFWFFKMSNIWLTWINCDVDNT